VPWQLSGYGRSDWSTKLIRGLSAKAVAGFQSRRALRHDAAPVTPQYAAFSTYKAAGVRAAMSDGGKLSRKSVTRMELCEAVSKNSVLSRSESAALVALVLKEISNCLERGEPVKLSSFGTFVVRKKGPRIGRNPKTGKQVPIAPRRVTVFKPSPLLKKRLARADEVIE
jgi:integration host factor subunit alpha